MNWCVTCGDLLPQGERLCSRCSHNRVVCTHCGASIDVQWTTCGLCASREERVRFDDGCGSLISPMQGASRGHRMVVELKFILRVAAVMLAALLFTAVMVPSGCCMRAQGQDTACKSNLTNIGCALEMYADDSGGLYPRTLAALSPAYLKTLPTCPVTGTITYAEGYWHRAGQGRRDPGAYTVVCAGDNHANVGDSPGYPQYSLTFGLTEK